jgi:hypothetical protein
LSSETTRVDVGVGSVVLVGTLVTVAVGGSGVGVRVGVAVHSSATWVAARTCAVAASDSRWFRCGSQTINENASAMTPNRTSPAIAKAR